MRAPPESLSPITGAPTFMAWSMSLQIFSACASDREPPNTVKSWLKTNTSRPLSMPVPVTTPSPGTFLSAMPKSLQRCSTKVSHSSKLPSSSSNSMRSRAVSLPRLCCVSIRSWPPPSEAAFRFFSSSSITSCMSQPSLFNDIEHFSRGLQDVGTRREYSGNAPAEQCFDILRRYDATANDDDFAGAFLLEARDHLRDQRLVAGRLGRDADDV